MHAFTPSAATYKGLFDRLEDKFNVARVGSTGEMRVPGRRAAEQ